MAIRKIFEPIEVYLDKKKAEPNHFSRYGSGEKIFLPKKIKPVSVLDTYDPYVDTRGCRANRHCLPSSTQYKFFSDRINYICPACGMDIVLTTTGSLSPKLIAPPKYYRRLLDCSSVNFIPNGLPVYTICEMCSYPLMLKRIIVFVPCVHNPLLNWFYETFNDLPIPFLKKIQIVSYDDSICDECQKDKRKMLPIHKAATTPVLYFTNHLNYKVENLAQTIDYSPLANLKDVYPNILDQITGETGTDHFEVMSMRQDRSSFEFAPTEDELHPIPRPDWNEEWDDLHEDDDEDEDDG